MPTVHPGVTYVGGGSVLTRFVLAVWSNQIEGFEETLANAHAFFRGDKKQTSLRDDFGIYLKTDTRVQDCSVIESDDTIIIEIGINYSDKSGEEKIEACEGGDYARISEVIDGDVSLIVLNLGSSELTVVSDPWGIQPLYYYRSGDCDIVATDQRGILALVPDESSKLNPQSIAEFLSCHFIFENRTLFEGVHLFPDGTIGKRRLTPGQDWKLERWYRWPLMFTDAPFGRSVRECGSLLKKSVEKRTGQKMQLLLSGGMDSRTILALTPSESREKMIAANFGNKGFNEYKFAAATARTHKVDFRFYPVSASDIIENAFQHIWTSEAVSNHLVAPLVGVCKTFEFPLTIEGFAGDTQFGGTFHNLTHELDQHDWPIDPSGYLLSLLIDKGYMFPHAHVADVTGSTTSNVREALKTAIKGDISVFEEDMIPLLVAEVFLYRNRIRRYTVGGPHIVNAFSYDVKPYYDKAFIHRVMETPAEQRRSHKLFFHVVRNFAPSAIADKTTSESTSLLQNVYQRIIKPSPLRSLARRAGMLVSSYSGIETRMRGNWMSSDRLWRREPSYRKWAARLLLSKRTNHRGLLDINVIDNMIRAMLRGSHDYSGVLRNAIDLEIAMRLFSDGQGFNLFGAKE